MKKIKNKKKPVYHCLRCKKIFTKDKPGNLTKILACPKCKHVYFEWLNYKYFIEPPIL